MGFLGEPNTAATNIKTIFNFLTETNDQSWISASTISHWYREVLELHVKNILQQDINPNILHLKLLQMNLVEEKKKYF